MQAQALKQVTGSNRGKPEVIGPAGKHVLPRCDAVVLHADQDRQRPEAAAQIADPVRLIIGKNRCHRMGSDIHRHPTGSAAAPVERLVPGGLQAIRQSHRLATHQQQRISAAVGHSVGIDAGHGRSGLATWGSPQPNLLRNTWKNS